MLKKLRRRFIAAAMAAFTSVVLVLLCIVNLWNYGNVTRQQDDTLDMLSRFEKEGKPPISAPEANTPGPLKHFSPEVRYMMRFFVVYCNANGEIIRINQDNIASISKEEAINFVHHVQEGNHTSGYYEKYRYLVSETNQGTAFFFLNSERELQATKSLLFVTALVATSCLLAVFILVYAFSRRAIAPFVRNIEMQKQFITDAGHELKTPLTAISTSADVLSMELENNEWVQNIQSQSTRMSRLIADLVTLSRLDEERPLLEMKEFSLSEAIWEISEPFSTLAEATGKEYIQKIEDDINFIGDRNAIQQMVSILLDNANKYSNTNGKIRLEVCKKRRKIEISVYNTCNISKSENIDRLFDRFYRSETSRSDRNSYGIGLSIAKSIAENHNGTIRAECVDNFAIWFIVTL